MDPTRIGFLRSRVARRVLLSFLAAALLPVLAFGLLAYREAARTLLEQARTELESESRLASSVVQEHLVRATTQLEGLATAGRLTTLPDGWLGVALADTGVLAALGRPVARRVLDPDQHRRLGNGKVVLLIPDDPAADPFLLVRRARLAPPTDIWAEVPVGSLLGDATVSDPAAPICIAGPNGVPLYCPDRGTLPPTELLDAGGRMIRWTDASGTRHLGSVRPVFLAFQFGQERWYAVTSRLETAALEPLANFRQTFLLIVLLVLVVVFLLGHRQIRRILAPLDVLSQGTREVAGGDLSHRVEIPGHDEFHELADSFNTMTANLAAQFRVFGSLQELGATTLARPELASVVARAATLTRRALPCHTVVAGAARPGGDGWAFTAAGPDGEADSVVRPVPRSELAELGEAAGTLVMAAGSGRSYLPRRGDGDTALIQAVRGGDGVIGVLAIVRQGPGGADEAKVLSHFADHFAVSLTNARLVDDLDRMGQGALVTLARTIDAASPWTAGHSERVTAAAIEIGRRVGLQPPELRRLERGGLLHDIGKIGVPEALLNKPGKLTTEEFDQIAQHPVIGHRILSPLPVFQEVLSLVRSHHEKLDGSGYPDRLAGDQIEPMVRILTVADIFEALTADRPYRAGMPLDRALAILHEGVSKGQLEAAAVAALETALDEGWRLAAPTPADPMLPAAFGRPVAAATPA